jgi:hypothetical protein
MAISDYLIKKGSFKFSQILSEGYTVEEKPVILSQTTIADGSIKIIEQAYSKITLKIKESASIKNK